MAKMKAAVFVEPGRIVLDDKPVPDIGTVDALLPAGASSWAEPQRHIRTKSDVRETWTPRQPDLLGEYDVPAAASAP